MKERTLQAYIQRRGQKPKLVEGVTFTNEMPATLEHDGQTFHFCGADLSRQTITFTDFKSTAR